MQIIPRSKPALFLVTLCVFDRLIQRFSMIARRFLLRGRVQGVGFRYFACTRADRLGVRGWVRNLPDGGVEIHAEADQQFVEEFAQQIRAGPGIAQVQEMETRIVPDEGYENFIVKR